MPTITFSEAPSGTTNPVYNSDDNIISFIGRIQSDGANPTSPVLAGSSNFQAPIFVSFENLVGSVSLDAGYFDNIGSTVITFYGLSGEVLAVRSNNTTGIITFSFSSDVGIASVSIRATSTEEAGFAIDNFTFGVALADIEAPSLSHGALLLNSERFLGEIGASSEGMVLIIDEPLSPTDTDDYFNFELAADATLEFTVFWSDDPDSMVTYTFVGEEGINQIHLEAPAGLAEARPYSVWLTDFESNTNPALDKLEKASDGLDIFELSVVDLKQALFDPLKAVVGADAVKAATALNRGLGWLTFGVGAVLDAAKYVQMEANGQDWRRELFVDVIDALAQHAVMRASVAVTAPTGLFALLLAPIALVGSYFVYDAYGQDFVRNFAQSLYDDFESGGGGGGALDALAAEGDPNVTAFDPDWYLATYADAALAVQSGEYGSAYLHYLAEGAAAGYLPSLGAAAIDAGTIVNANQPWLNLVPGETTHLQVALGGLNTDGVNGAEAAIVAALNDDRQAAVTLDGGLSAIANRMAMDLAINSANGPAVARALDPQGWSQAWSDGLPVDEGPGVMLQNFTNYVVIAAFVTEFESPEDVLAAFYDTSANIAQMQSISFTHVGVAEYGGVWTLVLSNGASGAPLISESGAVQANIAGSEHADVIVLGTHAGQAAGGAGADTMFGAVGGGNTLDGGDGDDALYGGQAGYVVASQPDLVNGAGATNTTLATAMSLNGAFDTDPNANIFNAGSIPHATVVGTGTGSIRYFSFTVTAPGVATFDLDGTSGFDGHITLYNAAGQVLASDDDHTPIDPGSTTSLDSLLTYTFTTPGTYVIRVADYPGTDPIPNGAAFTLHVSAPAAVSVVPHAPDALLGGAGADQLFAGVGNDTLNGGAGIDQMRGGGGNDLYYVDDASDVVIELTGEGVDTVSSTASFTLGENVEHLVLTGAGAINGTGNALANTIIGNSGANLLDGGAGADTMTGGDGGDTYVIDNAGDVIVEAGGSGADEVRVAFNYALGAELENLTLTGAAATGIGNAAANVITGNGAANTLTGLDGADILNGGVGNDTLDGGNQNDALYGGDNADLLYGRSGNDTLDGGAGSNTLEGGAGDDTYYVRSAADVVVELAASGLDTLISTATRTLGNYQENLTLTGVAAINGFGNTLANVITGNDGANTLNGLAGADTLAGGLGADTLNGGDGNDSLSGGDDSDVLDGGNDSDVLNGGAGGDTLYGRTANDAINGDAGADTIFGGDGADTVNGGDDNDLIDGNNHNDVLNGGAGADEIYGRQNNDVVNGDAGNDQLFGGDGNDTLSGGGDNDALDGGNGVDVLSGGDGADTLYGRNGDDTLDGGLGADTLLGGNDADTFVFSTALGAGNIDTIEFYSPAQDTIQLDVDVFTTIGLGVLAANAFVIGTAAADGDDRIIYDPTTGALYYDADGVGGGAAVQFATLSVGLALTNADFVGGP